MALDKEQLINDLNKIVNNHFKNTTNNKVFTINNATLPLNASSSLNIHLGDYSKIKHIVDYKVENINKSYFNVFIHCYGNIIEDVRTNFKDMDINLTIEDIELLSNFNKHFSELKGLTIK